MDDAYVAVVAELGQYLKSSGYQYVSVTPLTHQRFLRNCERRDASGLRDAFGWNMRFTSSLLPAALLHKLKAEQVVVSEDEGYYRSLLRFSTLMGEIYAHSSFPTVQEDAVFFGPDTYRFADLIAREIAVRPLENGARILDMGCGAGPGGLVAGHGAQGEVRDIVLADINFKALRLSRANAEMQRQFCRFVQTDLFTQVVGQFDLIVANPPYLMDAQQRTYRHGGGEYGEGLSQKILEQSLGRLRPRGRLILYTGSVVVEGCDQLLDWSAGVAQRSGCRFSYQEIDPDVFGEELDQPGYVGVDRIAAVGLVLEKTAI